MNMNIKTIIMTLPIAMCLFLSSCNPKNSRAEEALQAYEKIADELVVARQTNDFQRQMEIVIELKKMQVEYADIKADTDLNDEQRKRLAEVMKKIIAGGYDLPNLNFNSRE